MGLPSVIWVQLFSSSLVNDINSTMSSMSYNAVHSCKLNLSRLVSAQTQPKSSNARVWDMVNHSNDTRSPTGPKSQQPEHATRRSFLNEPNSEIGSSSSIENPLKMVKSSDERLVNEFKIGFDSYFPISIKI